MAKMIKRYTDERTNGRTNERKPIPPTIKAPVGRNYPVIVSMAIARVTYLREKGVNSHGTPCLVGCPSVGTYVRTLCLALFSANESTIFGSAIGKRRSNAKIWPWGFSKFDLHGAKIKYWHFFGFCAHFLRDLRYRSVYRSYISIVSCVILGWGPQF